MTTRIRGRQAAFPFLSALLLAACGPEAAQGPAQAPTHVETAKQPVVYGEDDRQDWYAHPDPDLRAVTRDAAVALIESSSLDRTDPERIRLRGTTLGSAYRLCSSERFGDQPTVSSCSGTLIDDDLVLTAGHCVSSTGCGANRWVFDYLYEAEGRLATIGSDDVYSCRRVLVRRVPDFRSSLDYAIVQLDRPVTGGRTPAPVQSREVTLRTGDPVAIIGFGSGLPAKIDNGGKVLDDRGGATDLFRASTDSFSGNSGSGVLDGAGRVAGILVNGEDDYVRSAQGCNVVNRLPEDGGRGDGEGVVYAFRAVRALCDTGYPSARLCGTEVRCGDGICESSERGACIEDCGAAPECGDGRCEADENRENCPDDCASAIDPAWTCDAGWYGVGDGCDCACGTRDPDCDDPNQRVFRCRRGQFCDDDGACATPSGTPPAGWTCDASWYGRRDGCDCDCGVLDPDCEVATQRVFRCEEGEVCGGDGACVAGGTGTPDTGGSPDVGGSPDAGATTDTGSATDTAAGDSDGERDTTGGDSAGGADVAPQLDAFVQDGGTTPPARVRAADDGCAAAAPGTRDDAALALAMAFGLGLVRRRRRTSGVAAQRR